MKTRALLVLAAALSLAGCSSAPKLARQLKEFEALGLKEVVVTGKFSHTDYSVTVENGTRRAVINHSNAWLPKVKVVRETKE